MNWLDRLVSLIILPLSFNGDGLLIAPPLPPAIIALLPDVVVLCDPEANDLLSPNYWVNQLEQIIPIIVVQVCYDDQTENEN